MDFSYQAACEYLFPRLGGGKTWSLGPTRRLLDEIGRPETHFVSIHVGGTNGKGSVAVLVAEALRSHGVRVGLYTSPHLVDARERILVDGQPIGRDAFAQWTGRLHATIEDTEASFFEALTVIALADIAARGAEVAVIEVGLGGRLDATNVLTPAVAAITNVGSDHQEFLGSTRELIAVEKAGIAKRDIPLVVGEENPRIRAIVCDAARRAGAPCVPVEADRRYAGSLSLRGAYQTRNAAVAEAVLEQLAPPLRPDRESIEAGFARAFLPGRFDRRGQWLFDVAHNVEAFEALVRELSGVAVPRPIHAVVGILTDKDVEAMARILAPAVDRIWVTVPPSAPAPRAGVADVWAGMGGNVTVETSFRAALSAAQDRASTVLVTGSFHTVGDVMASLPGFQPLG